MNHLPILVHDEPQIRRVYGEFLEMPGLQLTCEQARRLFGLNEWECAAALNTLVGYKLLERRRDGVFRRSTDGPAAPGSGWPGDDPARTP